MNRKLMIFPGMLIAATALLYSSCDGIKEGAKDIPQVNTLYVSAITTTSGRCGGEVIDDGGGDLIDRGLCYSTTKDPTTADTKISSGTAVGNFFSDISGLSPNTFYYIRAYAENSKGVAYGENVILHTYTSTVQDHDGNTYYTVTIGTQEWMASNLRTTHYNDGQQITQIDDASQWTQSNGEAFCIPSNNWTHAPVYGLLYNWKAVGTGKLAPVGWHVATDAEWNTMLNYLVWDAKLAFKLREGGTEHWKPTWKEGNNESGFTATPSGERNSLNGSFDFFGDRCGIWTATDNSASSAYFYNIKADQVEKASGHQKTGYAVRCIKD